MLPAELSMGFFGEGIRTFSSMNVFYSVIVGLVVGGAISYMTEYYTGLGKKPVLDIVQQSSTGAATNIIAGLATGMISTFGLDHSIRRSHLRCVRVCAASMGWRLPHAP